MSTYLNKLKSTITKTQSKQITDLLIKQKQSGEIQNLEEFRNRLSQLTDQLLSDHITPTLKLFFGTANQIISSETFDFMIERIKDDLETAFIESNNLSEILDAHKNIINNVLIKAIRLGIAELENKVSTYEFLAGNTFGFDNAQFNTFKASQTIRTSRSDKDSNVLFRDPRTHGLIDNDVTLDLVSEDILLPTTLVNNIFPKNVRQIFDNSSTQSVTDVAFESNNIKNIIDGSPGTYWQYSVLQNSINSNGIKVKIELDLGNYADVNVINIEAAVVFPMVLESIQYIDSNKQTQTLTINDIVFNTPKNIFFNRITTNKIFLIFSQKNALELQYQNKTLVNNFDKAVLGESISIDTDSIAKAAKELITSSKIIQGALLITDLPPQASNDIVRLYDYSVGFDNIRVGYSTFAQKGIFVSAAININSLAQLAIKSKETRPIEIAGIISRTADTYPTTDTGQYFHGSIEYWATVYNFDGNNQLIDINQVPILPVGVQRIFHENLVLSNQIESNIPNAGALMFYTRHFSVNDLADIKVYRNGTLLDVDIDWVIEPVFTNDVISPSGKPNTVGIRISHPTLTDFYTVSYTPLLSSTRAHPLDTNNISLDDDTSLVKIIDLVGDGSIRNGLNNILYINSKKNNGKITSYSKVYLSIILRRSSTEENLSPSVEEYLLLSSTNDQDKFNV